jgi:hypothetical protein
MLSCPFGAGLSGRALGVEGSKRFAPKRNGAKHYNVSYLGCPGPIGRLTGSFFSLE